MKENFFELCVIKDHQFGQHNCQVQYKMNYSSWVLSSGQQVGKRSISRFTSSGTAFRFYPCVADTERFCEGSIQLSVFPWYRKHKQGFRKKHRETTISSRKATTDSFEAFHFYLVQQTQKSFYGRSRQMDSNRFNCKNL